MPCETFDSLALGSQIIVYFLNPVYSNTWQPPNGDFWGAKFVWVNGNSTDTGYARIDNKKHAGGSGHEVRVNNINLCFGANTGQVLRHIKFAFGLVSFIIRKIKTVVLGVLTNHDQMKDGQATIFIWEGTDFICFVAELAEKTFKQVV